MTTEPVAAPPVAGTVGSEMGLMVAMVLMVLLGVVGMLALSA